MGDGVFRFDMYIFEEHDVRMIEVTATDLRKDLFNILDRLKAGEEVRVRRQGELLRVTAKVVPPADSADERARRFDEWMAKGPRPGWEDWDFDPNDNSHIEYDPEKKFKDLDWP